jgi:DNA-directed RNA polymerase subunit RPC12/RpoP
MPIYQCPKCGKEVEADRLIVKPKCRECKVRMQLVRRQQKQIEYKSQSPIYVPGKDEVKIRIGNKIAYGTKSKDYGMLSAIKNAFSQGYGENIK